MGFRNRVLRLYETAASAPWKDDLATTLFADQVASQLEDYHASDDDSHSIAEDLMNEVTPAGGDIVEAVKDLVKSEHLDIKKYLDTDQIDEMDQALRKTLHVTLEDVYNENEDWAHRIVLNFVGHGVSPFDNKDFQQWLQYQSGATQLDWNRHPHFESPYEGASEFIDAVIQQRKTEDSEESEEEVDAASNQPHWYWPTSDE